MDATQPPGDPGPIVTSSNNQSSGKGGKKIEEAKKNLSSGELGTMTSHTKRLVFYYQDHVKKGYPQTSSLSGVRRESAEILRQG